MSIVYKCERCKAEFKETEQPVKKMCFVYLEKSKIFHLCSRCYLDTLCFLLDKPEVKNELDE